MYKLNAKGKSDRLEALRFTSAYLQEAKEKVPAK